MKTIKTDLLKISRMLALAGIVVLLGRCTDNFTSPTPLTGTTITEVASGNDSLKAFVAALNKTGLNTNFDNVNGGLFTFFAPSNYAFVQYLRSSGIVIGKVDASTAGDAAVTAINSLTVTSTPLNISSLVTRLNYHIISSNVPSSLIIGGQGFVTMQSARLSLSNLAGAIYPFQVNANVASSGGGSGANLITTDMTASNGVVHVVDRVMAPITTANIWAATLLNFSVNYSVSPITVSIGASVIPYSSGSYNVATAPTNAVDGDFNLFTAALVRANLAQVIIPNVTVFPDFTVFAPTDGAFKSYLNVTTEAAGITAINALDPAALATIINYHIVSARVLSIDLTNGQNVNTLSPEKAFSVGVNGSTYTITDLNGTSANATITGANKLSNAGIVQAIDHVLLPN